MPLSPLEIAHLPCLKILWSNRILTSNLSMEIPQPTLSEMHSKQPIRKLEKLGINSITRLIVYDDLSIKKSRVTLR